MVLEWASRTCSGIARIGTANAQLATHSWSSCGQRWYWGFAGGLFAPRGPAGPKQAAPAIPVIANTASRADVPVFLTGLGTVQAFNSVLVKSRVDGQIIKIHFSEGKNVKTGDLLAEIDPM